METLIIIICSMTIFLLINDYIEKKFLINNEIISNVEYKKKLKKSLEDKIEKIDKKRKKTVLERKHLKVLFNYKGEK